MTVKLATTPVTSESRKCLGHALCGACFNGHLAVVKYFVEELNLEPFEFKDYRDMPLLYAVSGNHSSLVDYLICMKSSSRNSMHTICADYGKVNEGDYYHHKLSLVHYAAFNGNIDIMKSLISELKCSPSAKDVNGIQPIYYAARKGHLEAVKYLIEEQSCSASALTDNNCTPLCVAAFFGHLPVVRYLTLQHNCDPHIVRNKKVGNALHQATVGGHLNIVSKELKCGIHTKHPYCGVYPIHCAAKSGNLELFKFFADELNCDPLSPVCFDDGSCVTTLHVAARAGSLSVMQYIIETKECDVMTSYRQSPLHVAALHGQLRILQYLIEHVKMDRDLTNFKGATALNLAASGGYLPCVQYLLKIGSKHFDARHKTPLQYAVMKGHLDVVKYVMNSYSDMYSLTPSQSSPLLVATQYNQLNIVKYFIEEKKFDPFISVDEDGHTLLHLAIYRGNTKMVKYFIEDLKLNYMCRNQKQLCPLHYTALHGHVEIFDYFITGLKCDINMPCRFGLLPVHLAIAKGHLALVQYILQHPNCDANGYSKGAGRSTLHAAVLCGHLDIVRYLVTVKGIDLLSLDQRHLDTPLHFAAQLDKIEIVKVLVCASDCSKSLHVRNRYGQTSLDVALCNNSCITALYLIVKMFLLLQ